MWKNRPLVQPRLWCDQVAIAHRNVKSHATSPLVPLIAICDWPDPKICVALNNPGGSAILHRALCINIGFSDCDLQLGSGTKIICVMLNSPVGSIVSHHALCISFEFCLLQFAMGFRREIICVALNNLGRSTISRNALCMGLGFRWLRFAMEERTNDCDKRCNSGLKRIWTWLIAFEVWKVLTYRMQKRNAQCNHRNWDITIAIKVRIEKCIKTEKARKRYFKYVCKVFLWRKCYNRNKGTVEGFVGWVHTRP